MKCKVCNVELVSGVNCAPSLLKGKNYFCRVHWNEYSKRYVNKERHREVCRDYRLRNPNKDHEYYIAHPEKYEGRGQLQKVKDYMKPYNKIYGKNKRMEYLRTVVEHYGGKCICCGETNLRFLTIGHKNDDGAKQRDKLGGTKYAGHIFYLWLIRNNFPDEYELQVECYNCNMGKQRNWGVCPHKGVV
jgi:hypothetical protein